MTVKEIVIAAAAELGVCDRVQAYLDGSVEDGKEETEALVRCFNLVESELALDYLPLYAEETLETQTGAIEYATFARSVVRVLKGTDEWGNSAPFRLFPTYLKTQGGKINVRYAYAPAVKTIEDESDYMVQASVRLFAYGIACEYSLASGMFEEASVWDKKYKEAIRASYRANPAKVMSSRRWV